MSEPRLDVYLDGNRRSFLPRGMLAGEYLLSAGGTDVAAIELAVLWYTEGKGDEDLAVHYFDRREEPDLLRTDLRLPQRFSVELPASPLSYEGAIIKLRWCVRVRVFFVRPKNLFAEELFQLGCVPPVRLSDRSPIAARDD